MPLGWVQAGLGAAGLVSGLFGGGGSGGGSPSTAFQGANSQAADSGWGNAFQNIQQLADLSNSAGLPAYQQSYNNAQNINYNPYMTAANTAGQQYQGLANTAGNQMAQYGQAAQTALGQQGQLYNAGNQIMAQAFNQNGAQYNQDVNSLSGQVNAGQAERGLGNSPVGGAEYNQAMNNFNTQWNTQQLQNEQIGSQALSGLSNAGNQQGLLQGANLAAQTAAGQQQAAFTQQAAGIPLAAQQYVGQAPAQAASAYNANLGGLAQNYSNLTGVALPYLTGSQAGQQFNANFGAQQNAANAQLLTNGFGNTSNPNSPASWFSNMNAASQGNVNNPGTVSDSQAWSNADLYNGVF